MRQLAVMPDKENGMTETTVGTRPGQKYENGSEFWGGLIDEKLAARFLHLSVRTLQAFRQRGYGPPYIAVSPRCVRYRRIDLREWAEARLRTSTRETESTSS
jgi:hypothetical protein